MGLYDLTPAPHIHEDQLRPADVLLSRGDSLYSSMISAFDGSLYSHASLWVGDGQLIESTAQGVVLQTIEESRQGGHGTAALDVYRPKHPFSEDQASAAVASAMQRLGEDYGWGELRLAALVTGAGKLARLKPDAYHQYMLLARAAIATLRSHFDQADRMLTCSALVASAFREAGVPLLVKHGLRSGMGSIDTRIRTMQGRCSHNGPESLPDLADSFEQVASESAHLTLELNALPKEQSIALRDRHRADSQESVSVEQFDPCGLITPGDLSRSPSLAFMGRLHGAAEL